MGSAHHQTDLRTDWYKALKDENCVKVRSLFRQDAKLLKVGWGEDLQASKHPRGWNQRSALHVAARRGDAELVREILSSNSTDTGTDFKLLEAAMDGDYDLDALAMAVVNGNQTIVNLLISGDCTSNPQLDTTAESTIISNITSEVLRASNVDVREEICEMYENDCDFNFLNKDLYLFHFTFSTWSITAHQDQVPKPRIREEIARIREEIFSQAKKHGLLEVLLSELKDGQGRTALHVAVDSKRLPEKKDSKNQTKDSSWKLLAFLKVTMPEEKEPFPNFLEKRDSAGRTPLYRAAAKNHHEEVDLLLRAGADAYAEVTYDADQWGEGIDIETLSRGNNFKGDCVYVLEEKLKRKGFNNKSNAQAGPGPDIIPVTQVCSTALHVSIIHKHEAAVNVLVDHIKMEVIKRRHQTETGFPDCGRRYTWPVEAAWRDDMPPYDVVRFASTMNLAVLVGAIPTLVYLLKAEANTRIKKYFSTRKHNPKDHEEKEQEEIPGFLLAAAMGNPQCVKAFLDSQAFDPMGETDRYKNTALHHALKGKRISFQPHLIDFVGCQHVFVSRWENDDSISEWLANPEETYPPVRDVEKDNDVRPREKALVQGRRDDQRKDAATEFQDNWGQRQGTINLLLQCGLDVWKKNHRERTCSPEHDAPSDFTTWWYDKVAEQTQGIQDKLNAAANAIAVTSGLVATASYTGPLQPPLGYGGDPLSVQLGIPTVRAFVVCDSLSFYFAVCSLVLALLPSLPLEKESMFQNLVTTKLIVAIAVSFLVPSVICIVLAFAINYFAVTPNSGLAYHGLIVATTVVGGFFCLIVLSWLSNRLYKVCTPLCVRFVKFTLKVRYKRFKRSLGRNFNVA